MAARGRVSTSEWDPMSDDYNNSLYDVQYLDNDASGRSMQPTQLDHRKLYIRNIPLALNEQGLRTAFEKYGQVDLAFLSRDPAKRYALIRYETAAEARIAMMKLNRTEPLNLHINLAHAKVSDGQNNNDHGRENRASSSFVSSTRENRPQNQEEPIFDDEEQVDEAVGLDHNFHLEMEKIKLDQLRIQEEQLKCRQKMMMLQRPKRPNMNQTPASVSSSRRLLPDGRVIVQERALEPDASFTAGAGDSQNIPGLQRVGQLACIVCGARADMFCARCTITPYCSEQCQRKDWVRRHSSVCHNLIRLQSGPYARSASPAEAGIDRNDVPVPPAPAPLRQPRLAAGRSAPLAVGNGQQPNGTNDKGLPRSGDKPRDRPQQTHYPNNNKTKFVPPGHHPAPQRAPRGPQRQNQDSQNEDEDWNTADRPASERNPNQRNNLGVTGIKNSPRPNLPNATLQAQPNVETPQPKVEAPQPRVEAPQPRVEAPQPKVKTQPRVVIPKPVETLQVKETKPQVEIPSPKLNARMGANLVSEVRVETKPRSPRTVPVTLVPSQFLVEKLPIGESFPLSVERPAGACASKQAGFVCFAIHLNYETQFKELFGDIYDGEKPIVPKPGTIFAYYEPSDEGWYRARSLSSTQCALIDGSRLADVSAQTLCRALAPKYADIPEFCCVLDADVKVNMSLKCTILMKTAEGYKVSLDSATDDAYLGEGLVTRWRPEVAAPPSNPAPASSIQSRLNIHEPTTTKMPQAIPEQPQAIPEIPQAVEAQQPVVPDIPRPNIIDNGSYILLHVTSLGRACVRACDDTTTAEFEGVIQDTALYGIQKAKRLSAPPSAGDQVLCHYDGAHYRALVTRTKTSENRYKVQYTEYGNEEIVALEKLYECPPELSLNSRPARASVVMLSTTQSQLTPPATDYIDSLKDETELIATIPTGEKSAPSGSLVLFSVAKNKENVNKKLDTMCMPEWKKLEQAGKDIIESEVMLFPALKTLPLPTDRQFDLHVSDISCLESGIISGFEQGTELAQYVYGPLTDKMNEYCNSTLCSEPYLPTVEEICLAKLDPYPQWFRAVVVKHVPGASTATVLFFDYGNLSESVPVSDLRKCMPEFAQDPALAATLDIKDWPKPVTKEQLRRAVEYLKMDEKGCGQLAVSGCRAVQDEMSYVIEVPHLIAAICK